MYTLYTAQVYSLRGRVEGLQGISQRRGKVTGDSLGTQASEGGPCKPVSQYLQGVIRTHYPTLNLVDSVNHYEATEDQVTTDDVKTQAPDIQDFVNTDERVCNRVDHSNWNLQTKI